LTRVETKSSQETKSVLANIHRLKSSNKFCLILLDGLEHFHHVFLCPQGRRRMVIDGTMSYDGVCVHDNPQRRILLITRQIIHKTWSSGYGWCVPCEKESIRRYGHSEKSALTGQVAGQPSTFRTASRMVATG